MILGVGWVSLPGLARPGPLAWDDLTRTLEAQLGRLRRQGLFPHDLSLSSRLWLCPGLSWWRRKGFQQQGGRAPKRSQFASPCLLLRTTFRQPEQVTQPIPESRGGRADSYLSMRGAVKSHGRGVCALRTGRIVALLPSTTAPGKEDSVPLELCYSFLPVFAL